MDGSGTIEVGEDKYVLHANQAFCIPRFRGHCYYAGEEDPWSILWVHFKGSDTEYYSGKGRNKGKSNLPGQSPVLHGERLSAGCSEWRNCHTKIKISHKCKR